MSVLGRARLEWKDLRAVIAGVVSISYNIWDGINAFNYYEGWDQTGTYDKLRMIFGAFCALFLLYVLP